ncbi:MAG: hypothetical protein ACLUIW_07530 [Dysosmobacter welbionis]
MNPDLLLMDGRYPIWMRRTTRGDAPEIKELHQKTKVTVVYVTRPV